jgi:hypothetical protein
MLNELLNVVYSECIIIRKRGECVHFVHAHHGTSSSSSGPGYELT